MSKFNSISLKNKVIIEIKEISSKKKFLVSSPLFYEGQIPIVAYLLLDGHILLLRKKKIKIILNPGSLIGLNELMSNSPSTHSAEVQAESTICFLDKSTIMEVINKNDSSLAILFEEELD